jgi:hypothetical protein
MALRPASISKDEADDVRDPAAYNDEVHLDPRAAGSSQAAAHGHGR